jgi:hypothetical protein
MSKEQLNHRYRSLNMYYVNNFNSMSKEQEIRIYNRILEIRKELSKFNMNIWMS